MRVCATVQEVWKRAHGTRLPAYNDVEEFVEHLERVFVNAICYRHSPQQVAQAESCLDILYAHDEFHKLQQVRLACSSVAARLFRECGRIIAVTAGGPRQTGRVCTAPLALRCAGSGATALGRYWRSIHVSVPQPLDADAARGAKVHPDVRSHGRCGACAGPAVAA
jgi:hypothetical protein